MSALTGRAATPGDAGPAAASAGPAVAVSIDGWLFDAREFAPEELPGEDELDAIAAQLAGSAARCADLGMRYIPVLAPAKRNVLKGVPRADRSWVAELNARLRDDDEVELMGLLAVLRHAARHGPCYQRTDAGWNDRGAFFIARALLKEAHKTAAAMTAPPLEDLHLRPLPGHCGALQAAAGEGAPAGGDEETVVIDAGRLRARRMPLEPDLLAAGSDPARLYLDPERDEDTRLALIGDGAMLPVVLWLAECVRRTTFFECAELPYPALEVERPQIVIHLMRETELLHRHS